MKRLILIALVIFSGASLRAGLFNTNLIVNGGAEAGTGSVSGNDVLPVPGWTTTNGFTVTQYGSASEVPIDVPGPANRGTNFFAGGPNTALSSAYQVIDLSSAAVQVDSGAVLAELTGYLGGWESQEDNAFLQAEFTDGVTTNILETISLGPVLAVDRTNQTALLFRGATNAVPVGARQVKVTLTMTREAGSYNDASADNLSLVLTTNGISLAIQTGANLIVSWPAGAGGWQLQSTTNLLTPQWTNVAPPYQTNSSRIEYLETAPIGSRFYRLKQP
jgi:hypothetical protein